MVSVLPRVEVNGGRDDEASFESEPAPEAVSLERSPAELAPVRGRSSVRLALLRLLRVLLAKELRCVDGAPTLDRMGDESSASSFDADVEDRQLGDPEDVRPRSRLVRVVPGRAGVRPGREGVRSGPGVRSEGVRRMRSTAARTLRTQIGSALGTVRRRDRAVPSKEVVALERRRLDVVRGARARVSDTVARASATLDDLDRGRRFSVAGRLSSLRHLQPFQNRR
jgi:hypothetical protein